MRGFIAIETDHDLTLHLGRQPSGAISGLPLSNSPEGLGTGMRETSISPWNRFALWVNP